MNRPYRKKEMTSGCIQCIDRVYRSEKTHGVRTSAVE